MQEYGSSSPGAHFSLQTFLQLIRAAGAILGVIAIIMGLVFVARIFAMLLGALQTPDGLQAVLVQWGEVVGGAQLDVVIAGTTCRCAPIIALGVLGGGVVVLVWIAMGLVVGGAKVMAWTLGDRTAIKQILASARDPAKPAAKPMA